ncbi:hypothetical protein [Variovorax ginsengisoli]|uniref:Uncharacterized protein n=1 Tax=Variovorax ginsengisoli TaxID=363844 RepID=A0ABT9SEX5_9BURK|nr:hypothetical protein [Variovorax ginsengisoli]MDP9902919.1 hypothetical protein [Variovorax ginsengisoli]
MNPSSRTMGGGLRTAGASTASSGELNMLERLRAEMKAMFDSRETKEQLVQRLYAQHEKERSLFIAQFNAKAQSLILPTFRQFERWVAGQGLACYVDMREGVYTPDRRASAFVRFGIGIRAAETRTGGGVRGHFVNVWADTTARMVVVSHAGPVAAPSDASLRDTIELAELDPTFLLRHLSVLVQPYFGYSIDEGLNVPPGR